MALKRKRSSVATPQTNGLSSLHEINHETHLLQPQQNEKAAKAAAFEPARQQSRREKVNTDPDGGTGVVDGQAALRASPDADGAGESFSIKTASRKRRQQIPTKEPLMRDPSDSSLSELDEVTIKQATTPKKVRKTPTKSSIAAKKGSDEIKVFKAEQAAKKAAQLVVKVEPSDGMMPADPEGDDAGPNEDADAVRREAARPPPVNNDYLPLPWKGRLGYACLNTYLRLSEPPVFSSRTCRIASILEHQHPLKDPTQPEHATKNRPDRSKPADVARGKRYVEELGLANARDIPRMLKWNEKYGIRFLRLSSEMFPFASHEDYGYELAPFASDVLAEAGRIAAKLGHRLTTHPGQFTQLGSPRPDVIKNAIRDLHYHDELLSLLKLPPQEDRDAVMILHLGGTFGDKSATVDRFRQNYKGLSQAVKNRLVLENDDVSWSVHDLLPLCEELNIPLVLDFHHHNIMFDPTRIREGTKDIVDLFPRIKATWDRKGIRQKMHYSEPTPPAVTGRQRRKHNARPAILPPCPDDMDLMIEAKDKEQAVFELMRTFKLPGWNTFNDIIPYERADNNKPVPKKAIKKKTKKQIAAEVEEFGKELSEEKAPAKAVIPEAEVGMGGPQNRVYWPPGMDEWLRPRKREVKKRIVDEPQVADSSAPTPHNFAARLLSTRQASAGINARMKERILKASCVREMQEILDEIKAAVPMPITSSGVAAKTQEGLDDERVKPAPRRGKTTTARKALPANSTPAKKKGRARPDVTTTTVNDQDEDDDELSLPDLSAEDDAAIKASRPAAIRVSRRASTKQMSYAEEDGDADSEEEG
ncbi:MAG: hypothetical protein M1818_008522 [Claussenomyces sp. TS43310]|nr:MAG: hypothetical protein M1818_008522 [Claussenomyces sp. TS43310]